MISMAFLTGNGDLELLLEGLLAKKKSAPVYRRACTGAFAFLQRACMHSDRCFEHRACAGVYVKRVL